MKNLPSKTVYVLLTLTCLGFVILGFLRLNDTSLYTDSTRYVIWGTSFSHARGFIDDTQPDPERYVLNAPLYSVVLAPILLFFPNSLFAAKIWTLLLGVFVLVLFFIWLNRRLGTLLALVGTLILACNPLMLVMATEAMSEMCFLAMTIATMILLDLYEGDRTILSRNSIILLLILSFLPLLREVSVALVGAVVIVLILEKYYKIAFGIVIGAVVLTAVWMFRNIVLVGTPSTSQSTNVSFILGHFVTPGDTPIIGELIQRVFVNIQGFYGFIASLLMYPFPQPLIVNPHQLFRAFFKLVGNAKYILPFIVLPLAVVGILRDIGQDFKGYTRLLFCILYTLIIVVYPVQDIRFLLPLLPFLIYFLLLSVQAISKSRLLQNRNIRIGLASIVVALVVIPNLDCDVELARTNWNYQHTPDELYREIKKTGVNKELYIRPWKLFGDWIKENLPDSTVIAGTFKELAIFIGDRKVLEINYGVPLPMFERLLRDNGVNYILSAGVDENNRPYEFAMNETRRYWFEPVYSLNGLLLYKVHSMLMEPQPANTPATALPDTNTSRGILTLGRSLLLQAEYSQAIGEFVKASRLGSNPALTVFQITVAYALAGQRFEATRSLEQLYRLPQSTSYIPAATSHLHAMDTYLNATKIAGMYQRSQELFNIAGFYWNFGYRKQGYSLLRDILKEDTTFFVGLLWGWDYSRELGYEKDASRYLKILESIDRTNDVVKGFRLITACDDTLRRTKSPADRSRLQLEKGKAYWSIGLFDEAFDCVERSLGEDRNNRAAYKYLSELFEKTSKPWALRNVRRVIIEEAR
jgi:tetratricopeptide (TPR) repeat protein